MLIYCYGLFMPLVELVASYSYLEAGSTAGLLDCLAAGLLQGPDVLASDTSSQDCSSFPGVNESGII